MKYDNNNSSNDDNFLLLLNENKVTHSLVFLYNLDSKENHENKELLELPVREITLHSAYQSPVRL